MAIEVLSPDDRPSEVDAKTEEYLAKGVLLVVVVDPRRQSRLSPDLVRTKSYSSRKPTCST